MDSINLINQYPIIKNLLHDTTKNQNRFLILNSTLPQKITTRTNKKLLKSSFFKFKN